MENENEGTQPRPLAAATEAGGARATGIDTGLSQAEFAQAKLASIMTEAGWIVDRAGKVSEWRPEGVAESGGSMVVYGPEFPGADLAALIGLSGAEGPSRDGLRRAAARASAWKKVAETAPGAVCPPPVAILVGEDGSCLFLPARLAERALGWRTEAERIAGATRWVHPDLTGDEAEAFAVAALAYRAACGKPPFEGKTEDEVRSNIRDGAYERAGHARPGLESAFAALLDAALAPKSGGPGSRRAAVGVGGGSARPTAEAVGAAVGAAAERGCYSPPTEEELARLSAERLRSEKRRSGTIGRSRFLRKHRTLIIVCAAAALAVGLTVKSFVDSARDAPTTKGLDPLQVAEKYYRSMADLDHMTMEACVADGAGKGDIDATTNLFVISKVRTAYEREEVYLPADRWIAEGSPETKAMVYGPSDLKIEGSAPAAANAAASAGEDRAELIASYRFWTQQAKPEESAGEAERGAESLPAISAEARTDVLTLEKRKGLWRIVRIDRRIGADR